MKEKIIDHRQAEEAYKQWRKEHPEEAAETDRLWEESKKDPMKLVKFLRNKGFKITEEDVQRVQQLHEEEQAAVDRWLGRAILVRYLGYGLFGASLGLIVLSSVLQWFFLIGDLTKALLIGLFLIILGYVGEKVLG